MKEEDLFYIGSVIKPRGLKGVLKITSTLSSGFPPCPFEIFLFKQGVYIPFQVLSLRFEPQNIIIEFLEVKDPDTARSLCGMDLYIQKALLKVPKAPFSYKDLKGYDLLDEDLGLIGPLDEVLELPQQWIGVINEKGREILVPLNDDLIVRIDKKNKRLICKLPEGLLDIYRNP
jgi:16S rRNA processing protein RimM